MGDVVDFKTKAFSNYHGLSQQVRPTDKELEESEVLILNDEWTWGYNANVFFRITGSDYSEADIRDLCAKEFPMLEDKDDDALKAYSVLLMNSEQRQIDGLVLEKLDGAWEVSLCMDYFLESDFVSDRERIIAFVESLQGVQWQLQCYWQDLS